MKKLNTCITVLLLIIALLSGRAFGYLADVEDISGGKYFPAVKEAIGQARESVYMVMYSVKLRPYDEESSVFQLVDELIAAHKCGVQVTVILDQNINFVNRTLPIAI